MHLTGNWSGVGTRSHVAYLSNGKGFTGDMLEEMMEALDPNLQHP
jgi:hypothetical protein